MAIKEMNWTFDLHVENQLICSTQQALFEFQGHRLKVKIMNTYLLSLQRCGHNIAFFPWISIGLGITYQPGISNQLAAD
jgi:hypothetical protein